MGIRVEVLRGSKGGDIMRNFWATRPTKPVGAPNQPMFIGVRARTAPAMSSFGLGQPSHGLQDDKRRRGLTAFTQTEHRGRHFAIDATSRTAPRRFHSRVPAHVTISAKRTSKTDGRTESTFRYSKDL